jgi:hypothetical protein
MVDYNKIAGQKALKVTGGKLQSEITNKAMEQVLGKTVVKGFSYASLFISFVDSYSKEVAAKCLENVRRNLEVCPHIGQLAGYIDAVTMADNTTATVWLAPDCYWYFHPQVNYRVRHARQIFRSAPSGSSCSYYTEWPGKKSKWILQDCLACVEAHAAGP